MPPSTRGAAPFRAPCGAALPTCIQLPVTPAELPVPTVTPVAGSDPRPWRICYRACGWPWLTLFVRRTGFFAGPWLLERPVHDQARRLEGGDSKTQRADALSQKTRAHILLPSGNRNGACDDSLRSWMKNSSLRGFGRLPRRSQARGARPRAFALLRHCGFVAQIGPLDRFSASRTLLTRGRTTASWSP